MSTPDTTTVVIVPGLRDHVAEHWQTLLADRLPNTRTVEPLHHDKHSLPPASPPSTPSSPTPPAR